MRGEGQKSFGDAIGYSVDRIVAIENYRTPVKLEAAIRLSRKLGVNLGWLAEQRGPVILFVPFDYVSLVTDYDLLAPLDELYEKSGIKAAVAAVISERSPELTGGDLAAAKNALVEMSRSWATEVPPELLWTFGEEMKWHAKKWIRAWTGNHSESLLKIEEPGPSLPQ